MDIDGVADELYGLPPERFVAIRTDREKEARAAGDRELARRIRQLGKPSTAAWLANQLVRSHRDEIGPLLELGEGLRAASATLDGDQLRELDRQQHRLVYVLVQQAKQVAATQGRSVSEDIVRALNDTLHAALADEQAAARLSAARLTETLHHDSGFPEAGTARPLRLVPSGRSAGTDLPPRAAAASRHGADERSNRDEAAARAATHKAQERRRAAELEQARRDERRAEAAAREASATRDRARIAVDRAGKALQDAMAAVDRLASELATATSERSRLADDDRAFRADLDSAAEAVLKTGRELAAATERRQQLVAQQRQ